MTSNNNILWVASGRPDSIESQKLSCVDNAVHDQNSTVPFDIDHNQLANGPVSDESVVGGAPPRQLQENTAGEIACGREQAVKDGAIQNV